MNWPPDAARKLSEACETLTPLQEALAQCLLATDGIAAALAYTDNTRKGNEVRGGTY